MTVLSPLQMVTGLAGFGLAFFVLALVVAFGSYVGVLMALQTFFGVSSWDELESDGEPAE